MEEECARVRGNKFACRQDEACGLRYNGNERQPRRIDFDCLGD